MGLLYFIPSKRAIGKAEANTLIRGNVFDGSGFAYRYTTQGPGETDGMLCACTGTELEFLAHAQEWQVCEQGAYWVGYNKDSRPTPADLARGDQIDGHTVVLADGQPWTIPILRLIATGMVMPQQQQYFLAPDGRWLTTIKPEFLALGKQVERLWDTITKGVSADNLEQISVNYEFDLIEQGLGLNYRISKWELSLLRLLDPQNTARVLQAMIDWPTLMALAQKKTLGDSTLIGNGETVNS